MSHLSFAAAVTAGSCSQFPEIDSYQTSLDINLSSTDSIAPVKMKESTFGIGKESDVPQYSEKRARLDDFPIQSHSMENEKIDTPNFEYIPDSDAMQKTCLSPCGKASLTSAVVGSPVAGKPSTGTMNRAKKTLFPLSACNQFPSKIYQETDLSTVIVSTDNKMYQQDKMYDDVFRIPARPIGTSRAITKSPNNKTNFKPPIDSPLKGSLIGSMPPPFSSFENPIQANSPVGLRSITKKNESLIVQKDISLAANVGEHGIEYPFTRSISSDTDSDAGYGTSSHSNDTSNTSSLSVTRSNSTNLPDVQSTIGVQNNVEDNRNTTENTYSVGQNLDMDGLSELLRALSHQQGMRPSNTSNKENVTNSNMPNGDISAYVSNPLSKTSGNHPLSYNEAKLNERFVHDKFSEESTSDMNENKTSDLTHRDDQNVSCEVMFQSNENEEKNNCLIGNIGCNETLENKYTANVANPDVKAQPNGITAIDNVNHIAPTINEIGFKIHNRVDQNFSISSEISPFGTGPPFNLSTGCNINEPSRQCIDDALYATLPDNLMVHNPNLADIDFQVPPPFINRNHEYNPYENTKDQMLQERRNKLQYIINENESIQRQSLYHEHNGIVPSHRLKYPSPLENNMNYSQSFLQPPPQMHLQNHFDHYDLSNSSTMNLFPGLAWPPFRGEAVSLEKAARIHRSSAAINEASCHWSGQLPQRIQRNCSFSCKVFLGGVPWDISEAGLITAFKPFGNIRIEWPGRDNIAIPKGYLYILFEHEKQVRSLLSSCTHDYGCGGSWYYKVSSRRMRNKEVQVIPWIIADSSFVRCSSQRLDPQKTVFVGALHGMLNAEGLSIIFNDLFGGVVYAGIDTDKYKYPIGSARVTFNNHKSYMRAVAAAFIEIKTSKFIKKVQVDPYLEDALCSSCQIRQGPYFCRDLRCFKYFCRCCWEAQHEALNVYHKPLMRNCKNNTNNSSSLNGNPCLSSRSYGMVGSSQN